MRDLKEMKERAVGLLVLIVLIGSFIVFGMFMQKRQDSEEPWVGTITESTKSQNPAVLASDRFKTLEDCRAWANSYTSTKELREYSINYSCGTDCTYSTQTYNNANKVDIYECQIIKQ